MKTIGIIGGISWLSTVDYYRSINEMINQKLKGVNAGKIILYSVNFGEIKKLTEQEKWDEITIILCDIAKKLEKAGADCILIGANTMHKIADEVAACVSIPLIHIGKVTADELAERRVKKAGLLGTKYTMELDFYKDCLTEKGITAIIPDAPDRAYINAAIYNEMGKGVFLPETKAIFIDIIKKLYDEGAEAIILGCTEIPLLIQQSDVNVPILDTGLLHSKAAVAFALG
jgi:aspartate racemase